MKKNPKLEAIRKSTPKEVKLLIDHSFALVDRIDELMIKKNISQRQLADMLGKRESEVSKWMRGTHNFTIKTIAKLEAVLGESILLVAPRQPVIYVMNVQNNTSQQVMIVRGEQRVTSNTGKFIMRVGEDSTLLNEPVEQYN